MYRLLRKRNTALGDEIVALTRDLVSTPSPSTEEAAVADRVERAMRETGFDKVLRDEVGNVVGVLFGREARPTVLLSSHMDTVSPRRGDAWQESPYSGSVRGGCIHGLGAGDCKGGLAAQLYAAVLLRRCLLPLRGNLVVAATVAEEAGGSTGVRALMDRTLPELNLVPDYAVLGEPTGLGLYYGHDGWADIEIRVSSANPFHADDAARAIFDSYDPDTYPRSTADGAEGLSIARPVCEDARGLRRATLRMDRRLAGPDSLADVLKQVRHDASLAVGGGGSVALDVAVHQEERRLYTGRTTVVKRLVNAWSTDPFHPLMERARQALAAAGRPASPGRWRLGRLGMGTAGGVLTHEFGVPTIGYGPGDEDTVHAPGERVRLDHLAEAAYGTAAVAHALVGVPVCGWTTDDI